MCNFLRRKINKIIATHRNFTPFFQLLKADSKKILQISLVFSLLLKDYLYMVIHALRLVYLVLLNALIIVQGFLLFRNESESACIFR